MSVPEHLAVLMTDELIDRRFDEFFAETTPIDAPDALRDAVRSLAGKAFRAGWLACLHQQLGQGERS